MDIQKIKTKAFRAYLKIRSLLDLTEDFDEAGATESILSNLEFRSGNAWSLIFAILIASIGLHVNSTAVIIGAMLISPLMGSIVGAGFSLAVHDFLNLKKSLINLGYAVGISLVTSTLFFLVTPNSSAQSELIARTQPNFYDVLIAFFGGAAGIVASTRKSKGNAIPGVAIATALMPPLCTSGYGLSNLDFSVTIGALYLFFINTTFILISTYLFVRFLKFKISTVKDALKDKIVHKWMGVASFAMVVPSLIMAWYLHKKTSFEDAAKRFIENEISASHIIIGKPTLKFSFSKSIIEVKLLGLPLKAEDEADLYNKKEKKYGLSKVDLVLRSELKDNISMSQLDEKFLTKNDFFKLKELESNRATERLKKNVKLLSNDLISMNVKNFSKFEFVENDTEKYFQIEWKNKPNSIDQKKIEDIIYSFMFRQDVHLVHKY